VSAIQAALEREQTGVGEEELERELNGLTDSRLVECRVAPGDPPRLLYSKSAENRSETTAGGA
jgi:hypothetical protein